MEGNNSQQLPSFRSLDELVEHFEANDMGQYEDALPEVHFEVKVKRRTHLVAIDEEVNNKLTEIAEEKHLPAESLVNEWLREKISDFRKQA